MKRKQKDKKCSKRSFYDFYLSISVTKDQVSDKQDRELNWIAECEHFRKLWLTYSIN